MPYYIAIYDWSLYSLPRGLPESDLLYDTHSNDPNSSDWSSGSTTWIGETFTYNGGDATLLAILDDDGDFEDAYVETGGAQTLESDTVINGTLYAAGSVVENEFSMLDAAGNEVWVVRVNGENIGFAYGANDAPTPGESFTATTGRDGAARDSGDNVTSTEAYSGVICFAPGALIDTPAGRRRVEDLAVGDLVNTVDAGPQTVRWVSRREVSFVDNPEYPMPIEIKAGAFGDGFPCSDLVVSPQHRFVFHCDEGERLVPAKALIGQRRVRHMQGKRAVEYIHFAFDRHQIVIANGLATESCYLGPMMLADIPVSQRPHMQALFPTLRFETGEGYGPPARPLLKVSPARKLLAENQLVFRKMSAADAGCR